MFVKVAGEFYLSRRTFLSLTERTELTERFSTLLNPCGYIISHRAHRVNRAFLRTVSSSQKAFGIQRTQNVSAIVDTDKGQQAAYILPKGVSRCLRPFPSGEGMGEGPPSSMSLCVLFFCVNL